MRFSELFRSTARRKIGGGSKSLGADQIDWSGAVGGVPVRCRSTVRAATAHASFHVHSNARIHYGMSGVVPADAHFIDVEILSPADADAATVEGLARLVAETDPRPVRVRRGGEPVRSGFDPRGGV